MNTRNTVYRGERTEAGYLVTANGRPLLTGGFSWGYSGSGPMQLSRALLIDATGDVDAARQWGRWYLWLGPAWWGDSWETTADAIRALVAGLEGSDSPHLVAKGGVN